MLSLDRQEQLRLRYKQINAKYRPALEIYTEWMRAHINQSTRLLDAGCGPGGLVKPFVEIARQVIGVDRYVTAFHHDAEIKTLAEADLAALPFPASHFDLITCSWVLEHLADPLAVFCEYARILKPGGRLIFITPNKQNYVVWLRRAIPNLMSKGIVKAIYGRDEHFINPTYYRANTQQAIDHLMDAAGLRPERFEHVSDPTYLAFNNLMFGLSIAVERIIERTAPRGKVHLVGVYIK
jgi:ubiquinone/menaquinone biosynthesis C-methylase UbiE